jgi:4-amino-4-deoxy-L-arabinose transferase-like glycosyltransferase
MKNRRDLASVLSLIGLSCLVQAWSIYQSVVPAPDAVRYVTMAQAMARERLVEALRHEPEQPLFPALVWLSKVLLTQIGFVSSADWATAAQVAAAAPLILTVIVVYGLSRRLVGRAAALAGGAFFCLLPEFSRLGASGISDSVHLLWLTLAVWAAVIFFTSKSSGAWNAAWIFGSGVCTGVALLARAEALLFPLVLAPALALLPGRTDIHKLWKSRCAAVAALVCGLIVVLMPYLWVSDALGPKSAVARLLGGKGLKEALPLNLSDMSAIEVPIADTAAWMLPDGRQMIFGRKDFSQSNRIHGYGPAGKELLAELALASLYGIGGLALFGLWTARRHLNRPVHWFLMSFATVYLLAMWQMAAHRGYLSGRHLLIVVVLGLGWAGFGALRLGKLAGILWQSRAQLTRFQFGPAIRWSVVLLAAVSCLPRALRPFNFQFTAHRQAVDWLAAREEQGGAVLDSRGWTALYSGRKTYRYEAARTAYRDPQLTYVIVEQLELEMKSDRGDTLRQLLAQAGEPLARFADPRAAPQQAVYVYRWLPQRFVQSGRGRSDAR